MFPFPIATPQGCDIQTFYGTSSFQRTWNKPVGVSHVYIMLIGAGGSGNGTSGGGSGAVTVWYGAAQHVPNILYVVPSGGSGTNSFIYFDTNQTHALLTAATASGITGGVVTASGPFAVSGFYQSIAGQNGSTGNITASATTFLSGGADAATDTVTTNYGYFVSGSRSGFFQTQPIIVGAGGVSTGRGGIGCGGGGSGNGGPGFALIASW